jgi:hypothetical protein
MYNIADVPQIGNSYCLYPLSPFEGLVSKVILRSEATKNPCLVQAMRILRYAQNDIDVATFDTKPLSRERSRHEYRLVLLSSARIGEDWRD